jgi:hypothetical protein
MRLSAGANNEGNGCGLRVNDVSRSVGITPTRQTRTAFYINLNFQTARQFLGSLTSGVLAAWTLTIRFYGRLKKYLVNLL